MAEKNEVHLSGSEEIEMEPVDASDDVDPGSQDRVTELTKRYTRQPSGMSRAKLHWKSVRKHIENNPQRRSTVSDKWMNLTRSVSHGVAEFFALTPEQEAQRKMSDIWMERSKRLHSRSILLRHKKQSRQDENTQAINLLLNIKEKEEEQEGYDEVDKSITNGWISKEQRQSSRPSQSRQQSCISSGSSKRNTRPYPNVRTSKDSVLKIAMKSFKNFKKGTSVDDQLREEPPMRSRSIAPASCKSVGQMTFMEVNAIDDLFFDLACPTSPAVVSKSSLSSISAVTQTDDEDVLVPRRLILKKDTTIDATYEDLEILRPRKDGRPYPSALKLSEKKDDLFMKRMPKEILGSVKVNTDRKQFGAFGDVLGADYRKSELDPGVLEDILQLQDYRPFFTYWVTFVQIIIFIFTISVYDISYVGFSETRVEKEVRTVRLAIERVHYDEKDNMWIGPSQADLIHLGAKYSPCMRLDENVVKKLEKDREIERQSGCCIYNDGSGCAQMVKGKCPLTLSTWTETVCGQDPDYCANSSLIPTLWDKEDITKWPICYANKQINSSSAPKHMTCEIVARPCCVGILGQCIITTPDYCKFRKGYFHPEAAMCSQVTTCLSEICGMLPFYNPLIPNHFYRLWTSLFLHAGLVQLVITVIFQFMVMRNIEELLGWFRIGIIYISSGIAGSLASAVFLPYHAEAGPSGSQFAMLACLFVELIQGWRLKVIEEPGSALAKLGIAILILFIIGLFPWIDNWAHLFGFIFGFLLSFALMPYVNFNMFERKGRIVSVAISLSLVTGIFAMLFILFYVFPIYTCPYCHYFNCIPFTEYFCKSMEVNVTKNYDWSAAS